MERRLKRTSLNFMRKCVVLEMEHTICGTKISMDDIVLWNCNYSIPYIWRLYSWTGGRERKAK